jgi:hypothetical protein
LKRAERRQAERRKKAKIKRMVKETWYPPVVNSIFNRGKNDLTKNEKFVGRMAATPHSCSCRCCGNPRKHEKGRGRLTMQEIRELEKEDANKQNIV